jgi:hypothetical protein
VTCAGCLPDQVCLPTGTCCQPQSCAGKCGTVMSDGCGSTLSCPAC